MTVARREDRSFLRIDEHGRAFVASASLQQRLKGEAGCFELVQSADGRLVFDKVDPQSTNDELVAPIVWQGDIGAMGSTVEIINFMNAAQQTGNLVFLAEGQRKAILFQNGEVRGASSNQVEDRLGEILYRFGALSRQSLDEATEASRRRRRPLGNYLLETGLVNQADLYRYVRRQVEEIFYSTLTLRSGDFVLLVADPEKLQSPISLNAQSLLMEGLRRMDELAYFRQSIPQTRSRLVRRETTKAPPDDLTARDQLLLDACAEPQTVESLVLLSRLGDFETYKILHRLVQAELLAVLPALPSSTAQQTQTHDSMQSMPASAGAPVNTGSPEPADEITQMVDTFNRVFQRIYQAIASHGREDALDQGLETFLQFYGFVELFQGVRFDPTGRLDKVRLLANLRDNHTDNRLSFLQQALNELLFFEMFAAREWLDRDEQHELQKIINQLFIDIG